MAKCKVCKAEFVKVRMTQKVCGSIDCAVEFGRREAERRARREQREQARMIAAKRESLKTRSDLIKEVAVLCHRYVRMRDHHLPCISCGRLDVSDPLTGGGWDAGHYRSRGSAPHLRFDVRNIHKQCKRCNRSLSGNHVEFRRGLVERYGAEFVEALEADQEPRSYSKDDLRQLKEHFRSLIDELNRGGARGV